MPIPSKLATSSTHAGPPPSGPPPSRPLPTSRDILQYFFSNKDSNAFQRLLAYKVDTAPDTDLDTLLHTLEALGVDFAHSRAVFRGAPTKHCARCHETYDPRENDAAACVIEHRGEPSYRKAYTLKYEYEYTYHCCDRMIKGASDGPDDQGYCFSGHHTSNAYNVRYRGNNVVPCARKGCVLGDGEDSEDEEEYGSEDDSEEDGEDDSADDEDEESDEDY